MKTKTIYHLNHACDKVVRIEVIEKSKKKKKRPITINLERLVDKIEVQKSNNSSSILNQVNVNSESLSKNPQDNIQNQSQNLFCKESIEKGISIDQLLNKNFPNRDNTNKSEELNKRLLQLTKQVHWADRMLQETDKKNLRQYKGNLRRVALQLSNASGELVSFVERALLNQHKR